MKAKYIGKTSPLELTNGNVYDVLSIERTWIRIVDDSGEDYLYPPTLFEFELGQKCPYKITIGRQGGLFMVMNKAEHKALQEKLENPEKDIKCPRCGNKLIVEKRGNSIAVECKTKDCIYGGIRGL